ncbi:hypothetical protein [Variovorax soli]|uniref:PXPV repeat-containing protein n=1 Tax=Variovorax soli TaxID=376815 RepID=A0ABU1NEV7_9BURK|nr:hypothetical protein [Variovorax soli]MDR6536999.1 hypothetical protein [Variovorax soli]
MRTPRKSIRTIATLSVLAALAGAASLAQAEQVWARVISATPSHETTGNTRYNVTYEYAGQQYTTVTNTRPGASIPIEVGDPGVATTSPVAPQPEVAGAPVDYNTPRPDWNNVTPEQGVVVSGGGAPVYAQPAPIYSQPAPVYYPAPVYVAPAPVYYPAPYVYPPVGLSLNFGYSRGWHGHWR